MVLQDGGHNRGRHGKLLFRGAENQKDWSPVQEHDYVIYNNYNNCENHMTSTVLAYSFF